MSDNFEGEILHNGSDTAVNTHVDELVPTFQQIPLSTLVNRVDSGSQGLFELSAILHERKEMEEKSFVHYLKVSRSSLYQHEIEASTSERMLGFFKNYHLFLYRALQKQQKDYLDLLIKDIEDLRAKRAASINKHKAQVQHCLKDISLAQDALDKAKRYYSKAKVDFERSTERLGLAEKAVEENTRLMEEKRKEFPNKDSKFSVGRMLSSAFESTPEQERDKQQKKVEKRKDEMAMAAENILEKKQFLIDMISAHDIEVQKATAAFQEAEVQRMHTLQEGMKKFCELERQAIEARKEQLATFEEAVSLHQPEEDIALFIATTKHVEQAHRYSSAIKLLDDFGRYRNETEDFSEANFEDVNSIDQSPIEEIISINEKESESSIIQNDSHIFSSDSVLSQDVKEEVGEIEATEQGFDSLEIVKAADEESPIANDVLETTRGTISYDPVMDKLNMVLWAFFGNEPSKSRQNSVSDSKDLDDKTSANPFIYADLTKEEWKELVDKKNLRNRFLQELDHRRGANALLDAQRYRSMCVAMEAFLDVCFDEDDAIFAMRIANMSNTFYKIEIQEFKEDEEVADPLLHPHHVVEHDSKRYLQSDHRLVRHKIWRKPGFWEEALKESVYAQLGPHISLKWDEMNFEELREAISCVHNVLFGQLGTLSFSMLQQGLTKDEVVEHVLNMSKKFQLTEDQEYELIMSITGKKIKEYVPPPVIAVVPAFADAPATTATPGKHTVVRSSPPQPPHNKSSPHSTPKTYTETTPATTSRSSFTRTMRRMASSSSNSSSNPQEPIVVSGKVVQQVESTGRTSESAVEPQKKSRLGFFGSKSSSTQSSQSTPSTTTHSSTTSVQKAVTPSNTKEFALQPVKATTSAHHGNGSATFSPSSDNNHNDDYDDFFAVL